MSKSNLEHLPLLEQQALIEFSQTLQQQFGELVQSVLLFGSKARGEDTSFSDLDVLIIVNSDDWQLHKQICYVAVDVCLKYNYELDISPRIWSVTHFQDLKAINASIYQNICQDGIILLEPELAVTFP